MAFETSFVPRGLWWKFCPLLKDIPYNLICFLRRYGQKWFYSLSIIQWAALYFCMAKIGKSTSLPQLYANGGRLILYMMLLLINSGRYDVIPEKIEQLLISSFLVFFRSNYELIVMYLLQNDEPRDHFNNMNSKMTNSTTLLANLFKRLFWLSVCLEMIIFEISAFLASIWAIARDINSSQKKFQETIGRLLFVLSRHPWYEKQNKNAKPTLF